MKLLDTQTALTVIAALLAGHLMLNLAQALVPPAHAGSPIDCRIVDINTRDKLAVKVADIDTRDALNVKMERLSSSYDALQVKIVDWEEKDAIRVKIAQ